MKPSLFIRTDSNRFIGLGHVERCIALAHMLKDDFEITFYCREIAESLEKELRVYGFGLIRIQNEDQFFIQLSANNIVVLDGYHFDTSYQRKVKGKECKLACIDDMNDKEYVADLIINHAPGIEQAHYVAHQKTKYALGLDYALLRPSFLNQAKMQRVIHKVENLIICFGGSDINNLTEKCLNEAQTCSKLKKIIVVTGAFYQHLDGFKKYLTNDDRIIHRHDLSEIQMLKTFLEADLAIVPAGGILFEALAAGCIVISGYYIDNQKTIFQGFKDANAIIGVNDFGSIRDHILDLMKSNIIRLHNPIDGKSRLRLLKKFQELC